MESGHAHCGGHQTAVYSVHQTLDEMEFERGVWSAAVDGDDGRIRRAVADGTDLNAFDTSGYAPLHYAARNGHLEVCRLLLDGGAQVNVQTRSGVATPLHRAAYCGHTEITKLLKSRGADLTLCDSDGHTPLHKAAERGWEEIIKLLLSWKPDLIKIKDIRGRKALDCLPNDKQHLKHLLVDT